MHINIHSARGAILCLIKKFNVNIKTNNWLTENCKRYKGKRTTSSEFLFEFPAAVLEVLVWNKCQHCVANIQADPLNSIFTSIPLFIDSIQTWTQSHNELAAKSDRAPFKVCVYGCVSESICSVLILLPFGERGCLALVFMVLILLWLCRTQP